MQPFPRLPAARRLLAVLPVLAVAACGTAVAGTPDHAGHPRAHHPGQAALASARRAVRAAHARTKPAPPARAATPAPGQFGTTVPGAPNCPMFPADNIWNTDISRLPVARSSAAWLRSMNAGSDNLHPDFGPNAGGYPYGLTYNIVTNAHPRARVRFQYASDSDKGPYPSGADTLIEGGKNAAGDRHALMVNSDTCTLYELYNAHYSPGGSTAGSGAIWNLRSNALRPAGLTSADAAGLPILPGLVNFAQVEQAVKTGRPIRHAIRFTASSIRSAYFWPARHLTAGSSDPNLPPMGARFRMKARFDVAGFCSDSVHYCRSAKVILVEMQHYGLILADNGSDWYFQGSAFPQWPDALIEMLKRIPARAFEAVSERCLMVTRNSGQAQAKPGCPIG